MSCMMYDIHKYAQVVCNQALHDGWNSKLNFTICAITMDVPNFSTAGLLALLIYIICIPFVHIDQKHTMWKWAQIALFHTYQVDMHNAYMAPLSTIEVMVLIYVPSQVNVQHIRINLYFM